MANCLLGAVPKWNGNEETFEAENTERTRAGILIGVSGQGGIRTLGELAPTHAFQACSLDHSDTCPERAGKLLSLIHI